MRSSSIFPSLAAGLLLLGATLSGHSAETRKAFPIFDAMFWRGKPTSKELGLTPLRVIYSAEFMEPGEKFQKVPDAAQVQRALKAGIGMTPLTVLDIEEWPMTGTPSTVKASIQKYLATLEAVRKAVPGIKLGYYGLVPIQLYSATVAPSWSPSHLMWRAQSNALSPIADKVDALFPSAYTYSENAAEWRIFAERSIDQARRMAPGKPVYCFLWPQFYPEAPRPFEPIPPDLWTAELETCRQLADGIVLWGGFHEPGGRYEALPWNEKAGWWQATRKFLDSLRQ